LRENWLDATSLIDLDIGSNRLSTLENLPFEKMTRLMNLSVTSLLQCVVCNNLLNLCFSL
jgi:hypothetical protein